LFTGAGFYADLDITTSAIAGFGLAMSSTAFVMQLLAEKKQLSDTAWSGSVCDFAISRYGSDSNAGYIAYFIWYRQPRI
jgi:hypothetical protein